MKEFLEKFKVKDFLIDETDSWFISLRPFQPTIGSLVLSLKRPCESFSKINENESKDLANAIKIIENKLKRAFNYDKINYLMLMMVDDQLHFHVIPRYSGSHNFAGMDWTDNNWPKQPEIFGVEISDETARNLIKHIN